MKGDKEYFACVWLLVQATGKHFAFHFPLDRDGQISASHLLSRLAQLVMRTWMDTRQSILRASDCARNQLRRSVVTQRITPWSTFWCMLALSFGDSVVDLVARGVDLLRSSSLR